MHQSLSLSSASVKLNAINFNNGMKIMSIISKRKLQTLALAVAMAMPFVAATEASAHTVAIGWSNGANAGEVNLFMGSYHYDNAGDGPNLEGSAHLTGAGGYNVTSAFTTTYAITNLRPGNLPADNINWYSGYNLTRINSWEAVTMTGLTTAGTYNFQYACGAGCSAHWTPLISNTSFTFTDVDLGGGGSNVSVPEPMSIALLGLGLVGLGLSRRNKQKSA